LEKLAMKKSLIALAVLAASGASFAQSTVTLGGTLDVTAFGNGKVATTAAGGNTQTDVKTSATGFTTGQSWATSELRIGGTEDLGGGLKASFQLNSDMRSSATAGPAFVSRDRWLQLAGGFGSLRLGSQGNVANSAGFNAYTQTGTTGVGSTYGLSVVGGIERQANVINYTSPSFNGVTVMVGTAMNSSDSTSSSLVGEASTSQTGLSVTYAAGPLSAGFGVTKRTTEIESTTAALADAGKIAVDANFIGASYNLGFATIGGSIINNDSETGNAATRGQSLTVFGVTVPMGAITLRASTYTGKDTVSALATDDIKLSGNQISAVYALSKRTSIYAYTGTNQTKRGSGNATTGAVAKTTGTNIGVSHSF
jgi:predicted porin